MSAPRDHAADAVTVSFVIPQKGRLDLLERTLRAIAAQEPATGPGGEPVRLEVLVVTQDESADGARGLLADVLGGVPQLRHRCIEERDARTIATLRNLGARAADGAILVFLDADIALSENWTRAMLDELLDDERRVVVSAVQMVGDDPSVVERIQAELSRMKADAAVNFLSGHNLMVRRAVFEATGGFPEHLATCEDYVFADRANAFGTLYLSTRASYIHLGEDRDYGVVFRKERWRARSNLASVVGRRLGLAELPSFVAPPLVLGALLALPLALLSGSVALAVAALLVATLPPLAYTARLLRAAGGRLDPLAVLGYYLAYFPARGIGLLSGAGDLLRGARQT